MKTAQLKTKPITNNSAPKTSKPSFMPGEIFFQVVKMSESSMVNTLASI
jgi:hypothetical protein